MTEEEGSYVGREKFDVGNVHVLCIGSGMKEIDTGFYRKEENKSLIGEEFVKFFEIRLRYMKSHGVTPKNGGEEVGVKCEDDSNWKRDL